MCRLALESQSAGCLQSRGGLRDNAVGGWIELRNRLETSITVPNVLDLFATVDACDEARHLVNATLLLELFWLLARWT